MDNDGQWADEWVLRFPGNGDSAWAVAHAAFVAGGARPMPLRARGYIVRGRSSSGGSGGSGSGSQEVQQVGAGVGRASLGRGRLSVVARRVCGIVDQAG